MLTGHDLIWYAADRTPDHLAIVDDATDRRLTYRELMTEIDAVAAGFAARGVGAGDRVATALPAIYDHCIAILALQRLGAVPALLNFRLSPADLAALAAEGGIAAAVAGGDPDTVSALADALPKGAPLLAVGGAPDGAEDFTVCRGDPAALPPPSRPEREDPAYIFYTSGTTGLPKGVVLAHRTTEHRILWLSTQAGLRHGVHNRTLGFMPISHAIGFYGVFLATLAYNGAYYVVSAFNPAAAVDMVEKHGITYAFGVPTLYHAMVNAANYAPERMRSLQLVLYGGGAIAPDLLNRIDREWPATIRHIYGTTETMCSLYNPDPVGRPATLRPGFYSRVRVVAFGGRPEDVVSPGEEGELIVDANVDTVFSGYLNRPDATAEKVRDGWYYTGDICVPRADGDMDLIGRVDDMVRTGGENVHPEEVEDVLARHPAVRDISIVGVPDPRWGQIVTACVVLADGAAPGGNTARDLDAHCRNSALAGYKRPKGYVFMDTLPRNAANKVLRRVLRDAAGEAREGEGPAVFHIAGRS